MFTKFRGVHVVNMKNSSPYGRHGSLCRSGNEINFLDNADFYAI